ncbi:hypothetical protein HPB52_010620 [Rhipicephalus sanguineus]|uniref:UBA domain-containing protein n=1 Tax=Rhipicephalus sanguineus TaxID=34632 RepID=A0A9D4T9D7_RHISA|nr:hypothetical protein HPB52_010620 [Rhipicephalus sanguineus]
MTASIVRLATVMAMGFSESVARLALRSVGGDVDLAVQHIITRQDEKKAQQEKELEERNLKLRKRSLGKTCNGEWVSVEKYDALKAMGFPANNARHALQQANNDINVALQALCECCFTWETVDHALALVPTQLCMATGSSCLCPILR